MRELYREFAIGKKRVESTIAANTALAWTIEKLHRLKQLPSLEALISRERKRQTVAQMSQALHTISQNFNLPLTKAKPRKVRPVVG